MVVAEFVVQQLCDIVVSRFASTLRSNDVCGMSGCWRAASATWVKAPWPSMGQSTMD
jgi:hypothetical protein